MRALMAGEIGPWPVTELGLGYRRYRLNADALNILRQRTAFAQQSSLRLFFVSETGEAMTAKGIGGRMRRTCERAGIRRCIAYGFRHSYATDALSKGVPETTVAALLGHSSTTMLAKHYAHLTAKMGVLREASAKMRRRPVR